MRHNLCNRIILIIFAAKYYSKNYYHEEINVDYRLDGGFSVCPRAE